MTDQIKLPTPLIAVVMEDGAEFQVQSYNRDMLAWDRNRAKRGWPSADVAPWVFLNFIAWHAATREGLIPKLSLTEFEDAALAVQPVKDDDGQESAADPTRPDPEDT